MLGAVNRSSNITLMALDRISTLVEHTSVPYQKAKEIDVHTFFDDVIGVSKTVKHKTSTIVLRVLKSQLPYMTTKPMHPTQKILKEEENTVLLSIEVVWNYELEREIIGQGEMIEVVSPRRLRYKIRKRLEETLNKYL